MTNQRFSLAGAVPRAVIRRESALDCGLVLELAELFTIPLEHRRDDLNAFEELMGSLYTTAPAGERARVAAILAARADLPASIAAIIAADVIDIARPMLVGSPALQTIDRIRIIGNRSEAHRAALATRADLEDAVISALLIHGGADTVAALGANSRLTLSAGQMDRLVDRVVEEGRSIESLSEVLELGPARRIDIFFSLSSADRRKALIAFDAETAFRRIEKRGRRTPPSVRPGLQRRLIDAVFAGEQEAYAGHLAEALGITRALGHRIITDMGGEPLVVALLAAGLDATDATSILVRSDPALGWTYYTIRDLVRVYERLGWRTAEAIIERWSAAGGKRLSRAVRQTDSSERHHAGERRVIRTVGDGTPASVVIASPREGTQTLRS